MQDVCEFPTYAVGFAADLDGDIAAFGDEAVVDGGLLEHSRTVSFQRTARRTGAAYGPTDANRTTGPPFASGTTQATFPKRRAGRGRWWSGGPAGVLLPLYRAAPVPVTNDA